MDLLKWFLSINDLTKITLLIKCTLKIECRLYSAEMSNTVSLTDKWKMLKVNVNWIATVMWCKPVKNIGISTLV